MRGIIWLYLFIADVLIDLLSVYFGWTDIRYLTKPMIIILLSAYYIFSIKTKDRLTLILMGALFFSLAGDVSLLFIQKNPNWLIGGLCCFLVAHLFYITFFSFIKRGNPRSRELTLLPTMLIISYIIGLFIFLEPGLGAMKIPVLVYSLALGIMVLSVFRAFDLVEQVPGRICAAGALLFLCSDSLLAIDRYYRHFEFAEWMVMLSYSLAQCMMVYGSKSYTDSTNNSYL